MEEFAYISIISVFIVYYLSLLIIEKEILREPKRIIEKFLAVILLYAGVSLIYFSITGKPFLSSDVREYYIYIFIIGFISVIWAVPNLLLEFSFFRRFIQKENVKVK